MKGWTSSAASWESGEFEYSSPEFYLALSYGLPVQYLYGKFNFYWQSAGLFHREARDLDFETDKNGKRIWENPLDWLSGGRGGVEFAFDFGLKLRVGLSSFTTFKSVTAGAGLTIAKFLVVDYAFESHPVFSPVHRVSVSFSPYLFGHKPREEGHLNKTAAAKKLVTEDELPAENFVEERALEPIESQVESVVESVAPVDPETNVPASAPATPAAPQSPVQVPVAPAPTTPIIETDDEILE